MNRMKHAIWTVLLVLIALIAIRGLIRTSLLAGHDAAAYPVTQHQFHENIRTGVLFPRWAPDMRYGYGHIKLQYRPPLLHYVAELFYRVTGNFFLSLNLTVAFFLVMAGLGMFRFARQFLEPGYALVAAAAVMTANYLLADIYLRGAYYEVAAMAWMPWILWSQLRLSRETGFQRADKLELKKNIVRTWPMLFGAFCWCFLLCGHPQIAVFFIPLSFAFIVFTGIRENNRRAIALNFAVWICGVLLAAPYLYVAFRELPLVRMQLFHSGREDYFRNFLTVPQLLWEEWPRTYHYFSGSFDYLGRPLCREMRALNTWAVIVLLFVPLFWFFRTRDDDGFRKFSLFFYLWAVLTVTVSLSVSWGFWEIADILHTFNFPWRALAVTSLCVAVLAGLLAKRLFAKSRYPAGAAFACGVILLIMGLDAFPHTGGWPDPEWMNREILRADVIRQMPGIPQQFYTPKWVRDYAAAPARRPITVLEGTGTVNLRSRTATVWEIDVRADTPMLIGIAQYYYPGWVLKGIYDLPLAPELSPEGTMTFRLPEGSFRAVLTFELTTDRIIAYLMSVAGIIMLAGGVVYLARFTRERERNG